MIRKIVAVVVALIVAVVVIAGVETISSVMHPLPEGFASANPEHIKAYIDSLPPLAFIIVIVAHAAGSFTAGAVCSLIARPSWHLGAIALGVFFLASGILNLFMIPHPMWFAIVDSLVYIPSALIGSVMVEMLRFNRREFATSEEE